LSEQNSDWHWPSGSRDTTQFPDFGIEIHSDFRSHLESIFRLDGVSISDYKAQQQAGLGSSPQRSRTYRKMYERLGLLDLSSGDTIRLSRIAVDIKQIEQELHRFKNRAIDDVRARLITILSKYQLSNPCDSILENCDIQPYLAIWKVMNASDNKIHFEEMNRVILRLKTMEDIHGAIQVIKTARDTLGIGYHNASQTDLNNSLGNPVHLDPNQTTARIAPWYSLAGWGGLIISNPNDSDGFRHLVPESIPYIESIIRKPPSYYHTTSVSEWYKYFLSYERLLTTGDEIERSNFDQYKINPNSINLSEIQTRITELGGHYSSNIIKQFHFSMNFHPTKHFVILKGISGTGKTLLFCTYCRAIHGINSLEAEDPLMFICSVRPDWTDPSGLTGYFDVLNGNYIAPEFLNALLIAHENPECPTFVCLDEMNLARVEYYFADILSAMESGEPILLHSENTSTESNQVIPKKIRIPKNLYIVGTINIDESTVAISDKVLDRATVIDLTDINLETYFQFLSNKNNELTKPINEIGELIKKLNDILENGEQGFAYRVTEEILQYQLYASKIENSTTSQIDFLIAKKVLVKLKGTYRQEHMLADLEAFFGGANPLGEEFETSKNLIEKLQVQLGELGSFKALG
jgi:hypothetical protein